MHTGKCLIVFALLIVNICLGTTQASAAVNSINNNFTMIDGVGGLTGGTNDVVFTWDGTMKTAVAASGQVSNATLTSVTPFFGVPWTAHDVAIYGPGTYTVYADCPTGSPGCGLGTPVTFTVAAGQLGVHILFDWGGTTDIDVVDVWAPNAVFGPSPMCTDLVSCPGSSGANPAAWIWNYMSSDWNGDGINGYPMVDGPFQGFNANFNVNAIGTFNNNLTVLNSTGGLTGGMNDIVFTWNGAKLTSVAVSGQVPNATLSSASNTPFFGVPFVWHDVAVYGPGIYTIYDGCPAGSPGCGAGTPVTFTVAAGQLGAHILFDWGGITNIDVVDVWAPNAVFAPSPMYTGPEGTTPPYGNPNTIWDWMSRDWNGDGINGAPMTDGPFGGFNVNFNVMGPPPCGGCVPADCNDNNPCTNDVCLCSGVCIHLGKVCNDNNPCTIDTCNTATGACVFTPKNCSDNNACTIDTCNTATGACGHTPIVCNDSNPCTTDTCDTVKGCVFTPPGTCCATLSSNNFSMVDPSGKTIGGTNDVVYAWDGTKKTSVAASGQVTNALISSTCPFQGITWSAHDVAIYGPGAYTVYAGCAAGSPGCGTGTAINFTVASNQLGVHMLFDWGSSKNIDVVNVWTPSAVFSPSALWTGACGSNVATKVWDLMSSDWNNDGKNGYPMVDGPFMNFNANFNLMGAVGCGGCVPADCNDNNACTIDFCNAGTCVHSPIVCNDNNVCTADSCNTVTGCVYTRLSGPPGYPPCDDGDPCTINDRCDLGFCQGTPAVCNDNNPCDVGSCNPVMGSCVFTPKNCSDNNACTIDTCDRASGACVHTPIVCNDNNACTVDTCNTITGCVFTPINCDDGNANTIDSCDPVTGICVHTPFNPNNVHSINNNFTMLAPDGGLTGGTNDVVFSWDGTKKTSVAASGQVSNATLTSPCPFFGVTWSAHDVAIYGPGTYKIYDGCPAGSPGCGVGNAVTFTVGSGQLGVHILFDWGGTTDIDVIDVWVPNAVFGASPMCADASNCGGQATCGSNPVGTAWGWMSSDWNGDGINGAPMTDGPFAGFNANFNVNVAGTTNNNFTMLDPYGGITGGTNDVEFTWNGTKKTSVAASGQVSNASLSSTCPFFGVTWSTHDVAIYGPGTYTVYDGCPAGSPGCGVGNPVTFTVATGQLGAHLLFDWGGSNDIDVVDVWVPKALFGTSPMCADSSNCGGQVTCGANPATTVWDWMSSDWNGDGINGAPMTDGPFAGFNANFNVMGLPPLSLCGCCDTGCNDNNPCTTDTCNTATGVCVFAPKVCDDNNICTTDGCNTATGLCTHTATVPAACNDNNVCTNDTCTNNTCGHTPIATCCTSNAMCNDGSACTTDTCNVTTNRCVFTPPGTCPIYTTGNNYTMVDPLGKTVGGTNDIAFAWDGTKRTSVAASGQISNAVFSSTCPFNGIMWSAHDAVIYGPGTYTVYAGCAAGSPGCGTGTPITFTVGAGKLGGHMLFDWGTSRDIDVLEIWVPNAVFGPSALWTGACGSNPATKVWDLMSSDFDGDGINGKKMVDGPFLNFNTNFNLMAPCPVSCDDNNACTVDSCVFAACVHTPIVCNDSSSCTTDTCNPATGQCVYTDNGTCSTNNFTMIDPTNTAFGGTNDVAFTWDGTKKTSVAVSGQVSNATISSTCPFFAVTWAAHDVAVYGPGTFTVYSGCVAGSPGCGSGAPITFTVNAGEIGIHMLFDWNGILDIDVVNVMKPNSVSSNMWTDGCGSNPAGTIWSWASYDFNGDGINGYPMVDGPFVGMSANFNLIKVVDLCADASTRCNDNNPCTVDTCNTATGACIYTAKDCNDNNLCTVDSCNTATGACVHRAKCDDNNACTVDSCDPATGNCMYTPITTDDHNACTIDTCSPTGVVHTPIVCNDNNACTTDTCDPARGCVFTPIVCNDNNPCTTDTCNTATGCVFTAKNCNDNNLCTTDGCDTATGACVNTPIVCNDNNLCTTDSCNTATGLCVYTPVVCNDNSLCTTDFCDPATGCVFTPISCDDGNACTADICVASTGCVHTAKVCNDNNTCTMDTCNTATGTCVYTPVANGTACTTGTITGTCQSGTCAVCSCPRGSYKTVTLKGTGSNSWWIEKQIMTSFTVAGGSCGGCILRYTDSTITATPGTVLKVNWKVGIGPNPTSVTWKGVTVSASTVPYTITCPSKTGTVGSLVLSNTSARHGKDTDNLTVSVATN